MKSDISAASYSGISVFFQAEDGIRDFCLSRGLGDVYKRQVVTGSKSIEYLDSFGTPVNKLNKNEVFEIVNSSSTLKPIDLEEITESSKGSEFRGRAVSYTHLTLPTILLV